MLLQIWIYENKKRPFRIIPFSVSFQLIGLYTPCPKNIVPLTHGDNLMVLQFWGHGVDRTFSEIERVGKIFTRRSCCSESRRSSKAENCLKLIYLTSKHGLKYRTRRIDCRFQLRITYNPGLKRFATVVKVLAAKIFYKAYLFQSCLHCRNTLFCELFYSTCNHCSRLTNPLQDSKASKTHITKLDELKLYEHVHCRLLGCTNVKRTRAYKRRKQRRFQ